MLKEGDAAPDFCLKGIDEQGQEKEFRLKDFSGKKTVLYFYPKDNTPGCTQEACDFRDILNSSLQKEIIVLGVSPDSTNSHNKFKEKYRLIFPLLSDPDKKIAELYGAYGEKKMYGKISKGIIRSTFVIDEEGKIDKVWYNVKVMGHVEKIMKTI